MKQTLSEFYSEKLATFEPKGSRVSGYGIVRSSADGIVRVDGLNSCRYAELIRFENDAYGLAIELYEDGVSVVLLSEGSEISAGSVVTGTGRIADICVGDALVGRVVDPIGRALDGKSLNAREWRPVESPAPKIIDRASVNQPMMTGILCVDSMIPIGRGQRELIIGDRQTGKTSMAISAISNQKGNGVICVYCAIGQKASSIANTLDTLREEGAMDYTVVVACTSSDMAAMKYLAPYAACSIAESFMYAGKDVLIVYDDLSKHAAAYREMSLLLRRPSGREAYPGDVFYLHSRLLERAAKLSPALGGGSITALPIVETMANDISAYIPTNVISITDGQIYLETELFNSGFRPAVNVGLSVSRVGRSAQFDAMKKVSGNLRMEIAQYKDLALFAQFGADIDATTAAQLKRGERLMELLKQTQKDLLSVASQTVILIAFTSGLFTDMELTDISLAKQSLLEWIWRDQSRFMRELDSTGILSDEIREALTGAIRNFRDTVWKA